MENMLADFAHVEAQRGVLEQIGEERLSLAAAIEGGNEKATSTAARNLTRLVKESKRLIPNIDPTVYIEIDDQPDGGEPLEDIRL